MNFAGAVKQPKSTPKTCEMGVQTTLEWLGNTLTPTTITAMPTTQTISTNTEQIILNQSRPSTSAASAKTPGDKAHAVGQNIISANAKDYKICK